MTEHSLTINFGLGKSLVDPYWLRMELVEPDDGQMTVGEAAEFIDSLYDTSICGEVDSQPEPEKPDGTDWDRALDLLTLPTCDALAAFEEAGDPGAYDVQIRVYRSHQGEVYKLVLSNGSVTGGPARTEEDRVITLDIENQSSITLDTPIVRNLFAAWQGVDGPDIHVVGNTFYWEGNFTGVLRAEFVTVFDLISIHVTGIENTESEVITGSSPEGWLGEGWYSGSEDGDELDEVKDIKCACLAFYHYMYELLVLSKPETDESVEEEEAAAICRYAGSTHVEGDAGLGDDEEWTREACIAECNERYADSSYLSKCLEYCNRVCFKNVKYNTICACGGDKSTATEKEPTPCPPGYNTGSTLSGEAEAGGEKYIDCGVDDVNDPAFYEQKCCDEWSDLFGDTPLPLCEEHHAPFTGQPPTEKQTQDIKQAHGNNAKIIPVGPLEGKCGEIITTQDVGQQDCCDEVSQLLWDYDNSAVTVTPGSFAVVLVTGGTLPLNVSVRGDGFWLDAAHTIRDGIVNGRSIEIHADADACGAAAVGIDDGCSSVSSYVRSTEGHWVELDKALAPCGSDATAYVGTSYHDFEMDNGKYKITERIYDHHPNLCRPNPWPDGNCTVGNTLEFCLNFKSMVALMSWKYLASTGCPNNSGHMIAFRDDYIFDPENGTYQYVTCLTPVSYGYYEWVC